MKKSTILLALLALSAVMMATEKKVSYMVPVFYNDDQNGRIKEWKPAEVNATVLTGNSDQVTLTSGWYVVTDKDVQIPKGIVCSTDVRIILADGASLSVGPANIMSPGIQVVGSTNTLTIYGQTNQTGQLFATGGLSGAGIGAGDNGNGSNITINGGKVTATGGVNAAGIGGGGDGSGSYITINGGEVTATGGTNAAGIGGGSRGSGSNITINGGKVTATGGANAAGIGGGEYGSSSNITINGGEVTAIGGELANGIGAGTGPSTASNIKVDTTLTVKADGNNPPTTLIENTGGDLATILDGKRYVTIGVDLTPMKDTAIAEINAAAATAKAEIDNASASKEAKDKQNYYKGLIDATVNSAKNAINNATTKEKVNSECAKYISIINSKKAEALATIALVDAQTEAIAEITSARQGIQNTEINLWIDAAINDIRRGSPGATPGIDEIKEEILAIINFVQIGITEGYARGKAEAIGSMAEPCTDCTAVKVSDGETTVTLYAPKTVEYIKE